MDRRGQAVADARGADGDACLRRPRCRSAGGRTAPARADGRVGADRLAARRLGQRRPLPAQLGRLGQPVERLAPRRPARGSSTVSGRKSSSASSRVDLPASPPSAATMTGTRPSMSTHSVAASSASSVPARMSSTMERGVGGTGRKVHPARRGVASAMRAPGAVLDSDGERTTAPGSVKRASRARRHGPAHHGGERRQTCHEWQEPRPTMRAMDLAIQPLTPERLPDLADAVRAGRRPEVVLVHLLPGPRPRLDELDGRGESRRPDRAARGRRRGGPGPGLVAYDGDAAVGWVSVGPREDYERLAFSKSLAPVDDTPVWSIVCFVVGRRSRGQGVANALLDAAVDYARDHGARRSRPTRSTSRRATGSPRPTSTTAPWRCSSEPASRSSPSACAPGATRPRPIVRRRIGDGPTSSVADRPSSSDEG